MSIDFSLDTIVKMPEAVIRELKQDTATGRKIHAIKLVREWTNWGLKEAKDWVEASLFRGRDESGVLQPKQPEEIDCKVTYMSREEELELSLAKATKEIGRIMGEYERLAQARQELSDTCYRITDENAQLRARVESLQNEIARGAEDGSVSGEEHNRAIEVWREDYIRLEKQLVREKQLRIAYQTIVEIQKEKDEEE